VEDAVNGLGAQLAFDRLIDGWDNARRFREDGRNSYNLTAMAINHDRLAARYDELAARFDQLQSQVAARDREIADLRQQLTEANTETRRVRYRLARYAEIKCELEDELTALRSREP
jgi:chromosome segregation ATPase